MVMNERTIEQPGESRQSFAIGPFFPTVSTSVPPSPLIMPTTGGQVVAPTSANQNAKYILSYLMPTTGGLDVILPLQLLFPERHLLDSTRATRWRCPHFHRTVSWVFSDFAANHIFSQLILKIIGVTSLYAGLHYIDVRRNSTESMDTAMVMALKSTMTYVPRSLL